MSSGAQTGVVGWAAALLLLAAPAWAQPSGLALTEAEVARLAAENPGVAAATEARRTAAEARARAAGARPAIELELLREAGDGLSGEGTQDSARFRYPLDIGGVRGAERRGGLARREAELAAIETGSAARAATARRLFHEAAALARRAALRRSLAERLGGLESAVRRRVDEGDAAQLDLRRIEAEAEAARIATVRLEAESAAKWTELQGILGPSSSTFAPPSAIPAAPPLEPLDTYLDRAAAAPDARRMGAETRAAELQAEALARRAGVPQTALVAGLRSVDDRMGRTTGVIAGAVVSLPLNAGPRAQAEAQAAEARALRADQGLAETARRSAVIAAWSLAERLSRAAATPPPRPEAVLEPAEAAYLGGEIETADLIAAHRAAAEAASARIDLEQEAALARVRLDELVGKTAP